MDRQTKYQYVWNALEAGSGARTYLVQLSDDYNAEIAEITNTWGERCQDLEYKIIQLEDRLTDVLGDNLGLTAAVAALKDALVQIQTAQVRP